MNVTERIKQLMKTNYELSSINADIEREQEREKALNYYNGEQLSYISEYISFADQDRNKKIPYTFSNLTRKIINSISLTYINKAIRMLNGEQNENYDKYTADKDRIMVDLDRHGALLDRLGIKVEWNAKRNRFKYRLVPRDLHIEYDQYGDDVLSVWFPVCAMGADKSDNRIMYEYWDAENRAIYDAEGNLSKNLDLYGFKDTRNPYGLIPALVWDIDGILARDLVNANEIINTALTSLNDLIKFKSYGIPFVTGVTEIDEVKISTDTILRLSNVDSKAGMIDNNARIMEIVEAIKFQIQTVSENYGVNFNWGIQGDVSGFSLMVQNVELYDQIRVNNEKKRYLEEELFIIEKAVLEHATNGTFNGEFTIDFSEYHMPINKNDKAMWEKHLIETRQASSIDLIMQNNPDLSREDAEKIYEGVIEDLGNVTRATTPEQPRDEIAEALLGE